MLPLTRDWGNIVDALLQAGAPMTQKLQAIQHGLQQLREVDQTCQSILDAGHAGAEAEAHQHSQRGWHLAKKCSGWANEVQVCGLPTLRLSSYLQEARDA